MPLYFGITKRIKSISSNTTITGKEDIYSINCASGNITVTFPTAVGKLGKILEFIKNETSSNNMVITPNGSETINGMARITLNQAYSPLILKSDNSNWIAEWHPILKQYALTVTATNWTTNKAIGTPYQTIDGIWRLTFTINGAVTSATRTSFTITVTGILSPNRGLGQCIYACSDSATMVLQNFNFLDNSNQMNITHSSVTTTEYRFNGEVELAQKPTFAD